MIHVAKIEDVQGIVELLRTYYNESQYNKFLTFDDERCRETAELWMNDICFVAKDGHKIVAVAVMDLMKSYYKELEADIGMFYVHPDYRGTTIARLLVNACVENAKAHKCAVIYSSSLSKIDGKNHQIYVNLWKKFGFQELGSFMFGSFTYG